MIKNECDIVKDLLPSYIEGNLSDTSKEFVNSHIKTCKYCKETLNLLKNGEDIEEAKKQAEDNAEIDYLKKYNRKINILKILSSLLVVFIVVSWSLIGIRKIKDKKEYDEKYAKGEYVKSIIEPIYNKACEIENGENYVFTKESIEGGKVVKTYKYYYKDDLSKKEFRTNVIGTSETSNISSFYDEIYSDHDEYGIGKSKYSGIEQVINKNLQTGNYYGTGLTSTNNFNNFFGALSFLPVYYNNNYDIMDFANVNIKEDSYEGKEYYIISDEIWVDKETNLVIYYGKENNIEYKYTWEIGNVKNEDVMLPEYKGNRRRL